MFNEQEIEELKKIEFNNREKRLNNAIPQKLVYTENTKQKLHITYVMTWTGVCGGSKIILEHANKLTLRGHKVTLISHDNKPVWYPLNSDIEFIQVPYDKVLCEQIPKCDIIVATYWREIYECIEQKIAPVIYFEQGDYHLFDLKQLDDRTFEYIKKQLKTVKFIYTVSNFAKNKLKEIYDVEAEVIPNAVDDSIFYYEPHKKNSKLTITVIGAEQAEFKRITNIIKAIEIVKSKGYDINLNWITPVTPINPVGNVIVNPKQIVIGDTLRNTDIYICASIYESFCLPVLEAMTCGTAIITTNNGGNMDFVEDGRNALLVQKDNIEDMVDKIKTLIENSDLRYELSKNAVKTSKLYSWNKTIDEIEKYYKNVNMYEVLL